MTDILSTLRAKSAQRQRPAELLTTHLAYTRAAAAQLRRRVGRLNAAEEIFDGSFWTAVELAGLAHDGGKVPEGFQRMLTGRIRSWGERHEVASLGFLPSLINDPDLLSWVATAVATHHRALTGQTGHDLETLYGSVTATELADRFGTVDPRAVAALEAWLRETASRAGLPVAASQDHDGLTTVQLVTSAHQMLGEVLDRWADRVGRMEGLAAVLLQGAVTLADHLSSAHQALSTVQPLDATFRLLLEKQFADRGRTLRKHQLQAADITEHLLLRGPTGSGKTEAALLWAARQVAALAAADGGVPRVFFTLPYLSSINAMAKRLGETLGDPTAVGVAHSRAASYHLAAAISAEDGDEEHEDGSPCRVDAATKALSRAAATKLFHESVRVGTPYQLLRAALAGPAHSGILVDAANSVFILDELHAYDARRLGYILASARLWERLGGRIAVLSATLPGVLASLFEETLTERTALLDAPDLGLPTRHLLRTRSHHLTDPSALEEIRLRLAQDESVLVIANNVAHALELYEELAPAVRARHGDNAALLLHSRFRRMDRSRIEKKIARRFGTVAPDAQYTRLPGLLVATQVVEVSLDVDFDVLFTSAAPLEALLQRFGRINRIGARPPADAIVHHPAWTTRRRQTGEYADGIYPREPVESTWHILTRHKGRAIDESDATGWLDEVYATDWGAQWRNEVLERRDSFDRAFLQFRYPFEDRTALSETFDELFDGTEAILAEDRDDYADALAEAGHDHQSAGRLLADEYLIPMPHWAGSLTRYERSLKIRIIEGDYDPDHGLLAVRGLPQQTYRAGEVL
ncbi:CRISPR-associated helicase Cas3' [Streptomyces sp. NBC_01142]|uniref:CRISPR-associated helicase Cas3' n=1 Tax=Streptomyces sp. NBC_01142 TaxID=2975865 RepID=UPI0022565B1B|nr:CRISPR-associated helicase Cas3' [Streptomyces sp. NBC_01142]MCX4825993.1 CRISPR-associated helicase Cas3' [Streptomyces sp. NBC_01142]